MTIGRLIEGRSNAIITCPAHTLVRDAVALLAERRIGAMPVMRDGILTGIFSERDLVYRLSELGEAALALTVGDVMKSPPVTATPETSVLAALSLMTRRRIRHLPIVAGQEMIGFVSIGDLVKHRIDQIENDAAAMRSYIQSV